MSVPEKTPDEAAAQKARYLKAKSNGFGQGKEVSPVKRDITQHIDEAMEPRLDRMTRKMLEAWEAGLDSSNIKVRVDTAHRLMSHLYRPASTIKVEGDGSGGGNTVNFNIISTDGMSAEDRAMLERVKRATSEAQDVIEGDVVGGDDA